MKTFIAKMKKTILLLVVLLSFSNAHAQLNGSYTIGPSSPVFPTFSAAVDSLISQGIAGQVTFNVESGTYTEQLTIPAITGTSAVNTIVFQSVTYDSNDVVLTYSANSTDNFTVKLDGADYIEFRWITIRSENSTYGRVVAFENGATNIVIRNNRLIAPTVTLSNDQVAILYSSSSSRNDTSILIRNNYFERGNYGICFNATSADDESGVQILNNRFYNQYWRAVYLQGQRAVVFDNNIIQGLTGAATSSYVGLYLYECDQDIEILKNKIYTSNTTVGQGVYMLMCNGSSGSEGLFANNFVSVSDISYGSTGYGILINNCSYQNIFYNNINVFGGVVYGSSTGSASIRISTAASNLQIKNNALSNKSYGYAFHAGSLSSGITSNYNCLYTNNIWSIIIGRWSNADVTTTNWKSTTGQDAQSQIGSGNIVFNSNEDLHTSSMALYHNGTPLASITDDIDGYTRDASHPCIGACEYDPRMHGTYTIDPASPRYPTFKAAVDSLLYYGVREAVVFNANSGTYNEQIRITPITGASAVNTITFQSATGDSTDVILTYASSNSNDKYTVCLSQADYIRFCNMTIRATGATYGLAVYMFFGANYNEFHNNVIYGVSTTSTDYANLSLVYVDWELGNNHNKFMNNRFVYGSAGIYIDRYESGDLGTEICNNSFINQYTYAIRLHYQLGAKINGNQIRTNSTYANYKAIALNECDGAIEVNKNNLYLSNAKSFGIELAYCDGSDGNEGLITNNFVKINSGVTSIARGMQMYSSTYQKIYYNSVAIGTGLTINTRALNLDNSNHIDLKNNIFSNQSSASYAVYNYNSTAIESDYNDLYSLGKVGYWDGYDRTSLSDWQEATQLDSNSISAAVTFVNDSNLHTNTLALSSAGIALADVTDDFDGDTRGVCRTVIGADEFVADLGITINADPDTVCNGSTTRLTTTDVGGSGCYTYSWASNPAGFSYEGNDTMATITQNTTFYATIDDGSTTALDSIVVYVKNVPTKAGKPSGEILLCSDDSVVYTTIGASGATSYAWGIKPAEAGTVTGTTTSASVKYNVAYTGGSAKLYVKGVNNCGAGETSDSLEITISNIPTKADTPAGEDTVCANGADEEYATTGASYALSYQWSIYPATAGTISGTSVIGTVNWNNAFAGGNAKISVRGINDCGNGVYSDSLTVTVNTIPAKATKPTGAPSVCATGDDEDYNTTSGGASSFVWGIYPATAGTVSGTSTIGTVNWNSGYTGDSAKVFVYGVNDCGNGTLSDTMRIKVYRTPSKPTQPSGTEFLCKNSPNTNYTTSGSTGATSYIWGVRPVEAGVFSGTGTTGTINWNNTFYGTAKIFVKGNNMCATSSTSDTLEVLVLDAPGKPDKPDGDTAVCAGDENIFYSITGAAGAISYAWTVTPIEAGTISGTTTAAGVDWSSSFSGDARITVKGVADCIGEVSDSLIVHVAALPSKPETPDGDNIEFCTNNTSNVYCYYSSCVNADSLRWSLTPAEAGTITLTESTDSIFVEWSQSFYGAEAKISTIGVNSCGIGVASDSLTLILHTLATVPTKPTGDTLLCENPGNSQYTTSSTGASYYLWSIYPAGAGFITGSPSTHINTVNWTDDYVGTAWVFVKAHNNCGNTINSDSIEVVIESCTGIADSDNGFKIAISPNPSNGNFNITMAGFEGKTKLCVSDYQGRLVSIQVLDVSGGITHSIDLSNQPKGIYYLKVINNTINRNYKIVVQ